MTTTDPNPPAEENWAAEGPPKGVRIRVPIAIAVVAVVALLGIWGGAQLKGDNTTATVTAGQGGGQGGRGRFGSGGPGGQGGGRGAGGGGTFGTVLSVSGDTITLKDQQGNTRTITLTS